MILACNRLPGRSDTLLKSDVNKKSEHNQTNISMKPVERDLLILDRKSTRLNSSHERYLVCRLLLEKIDL